MSDDHTLARTLAEEAGRLLLACRTDPARVTSADLIADDYIAAALAAARPGDAVLSEEGPDDPNRLRADRVWIVDPLDGTREYREAGRADWAVHIALWADGALSAGAVALPAQARTLSTASPPTVPAGGARRIVVSRTRPPAFAASLATALGMALVPMGSVGAKVAAVLSGDADAYVHAGGQHEWDSAAPVAVASAAGLHASRLDGSPLVYNQASTWIPDLLVCRRDLAARIIEGLR